MVNDNMIDITPSASVFVSSERREVVSDRGAKLLARNNLGLCPTRQMQANEIVSRSYKMAETGWTRRHFVRMYRWVCATLALMFGVTNPA